jgi:hypothetical protein
MESVRRLVARCWLSVIAHAEGSMTRRTSTSILALVSTLVTGCSSAQAPPYADLPLRDALGADPAVLATMPPDELTAIADRLELERAAQHEAGSLPLDGLTSPAGAVRAMDDRRRVRGDEALVAGQLDLRAAETATVHPMAALPDGGAPAERASRGPVTLPALEGTASTDTRELEMRALEGHGGEVLDALVRTSGARRLVRVTQWPTGAVAVGDIVYVNGSWLVAMSALDSRDGGLRSAPRVIVSLVPPTDVTPLSLRGSPFAPYPTLAACIADVTSRCQACLAGGACDSSATLTDFQDGRSECAFLVGAAGDAGADQPVAELCLLALTSIASVAQCVEADSCVPPPVNDSVAGLPAADAFLADDACVRSLDLCLSGQNAPIDAGASNVNVNVSGCMGPFDACASTFNALGDACSAGNCSGHGGPSCSSCNGCTTCSSCAKDTRTGTGTGYGSAGTGQDPRQGASSSGSSGSGSSGSASSGSGSASSGSGSGSGSSSGTGGSASSSGAGGRTVSGGNGCHGCSGGGGGVGSSGSSGCAGGSTGGSSGGSSGCSGCNGQSGSGGGSGSNSQSGCSCSGGGGSSSGGSSSSGGGNCSKCDVAEAKAPSRPPDPPVSLLLMGWPALYLTRRIRGAERRS